MSNIRFNRLIVATVLSVLLPVLCAGVCLADSPYSDFLQKQATAYESQYTVQIDDWRFSRPDTAGEEAPSYDDSGWQRVSVGFSWAGVNTNVWFRRKIVIPATVNGQSVAGCPVILDLGVDDDGQLYIGGQLKEQFHWDDCRYTLTQHAHPGDVYEIAVRGMNGPGDGQLRRADLFYDVAPELGELSTDAQFATDLQGNVSPAQSAKIGAVLAASRRQISFDSITPANIDQARSQLAAARAKLAAIEPIAKTHGMDVYYVGHSHIDMGWLWTLADTVQTCRRTWNTVLNLMQQFPDFHFVQSQPGAYVPIQNMYPEEFAGMQAAVKRGQWDPVSAFWDESDTDMPSGEALARSLYLGQNYFKTYFGRYATTGWLPDSFGHSWQLPQLFREVGINAYYHMRCGDGIPFTWWEAPDGSKVFDMNTDSYDANVETGQLAAPWDNERRYDLPLSMVVFGVGDHGGGVTREQLLRIKNYQADPLLPKVHMVGIDSFVKTFGDQPAESTIPTLDTDMQFIFEGCYTTHADMKKAVRDSENNLYSAEVLSSLASMAEGASYPVDGFDAAWKPTTFAQFHDIMCGSAIHSTYVTMHQRLAPAFAFEKKQTDTALGDLDADVDTRGPSADPIVVWNTLSFPRNDIVRVAMANPAEWHSVLDSAGHRYPAQADGGDLVFVARNVPAFGHAVYFPSRETCRPDPVSLKTTAGAYVLDNPTVRITISRSTGAVTSLLYKPRRWQVFGNARDGNTFQLLGDKGSAWGFGYTGQDQRLLGQDVKVSVISIGPVFDRIRVTHTNDKSTYTQDITVYGALGRIDVPTTVAWHEHEQALKIRFPINAAHPVAWAQIPFGSIQRPTTGQECPGQKWMDLTDATPRPVANPTPLDIAQLFNSHSADNFDTQNRAYASATLPARGIYRLGLHKVPFRLLTGGDGPDNVAAMGEVIRIPAGAAGNTLYLLGASAPGDRSAGMMMHFADGTVQNPVFDLNDWVAGGHWENEIGLQFPYRISSGAKDAASQPKLWIEAIPITHSGLTEVRLPNDPAMHIFAATIATARPDVPVRGLSILNDCKYGFDSKGSLFRLTALRSSNSPDPNPDEGTQVFTYSLYPHGSDWQAAHTEDEGLDINIPLQARVTTSHPGGHSVPTYSMINLDNRGEVIASALKHSEHGGGYILRLYEADGQDTHIRLVFGKPVSAYETNILELPVHLRTLGVHGNSVTLPMGHNQIVTLHIDI